jgi:DDE superfamily endonuclease
VAPTLPTAYSWYPVGERLAIPYEAPQGRRVNAIGAYFSHGPQAGRFEFETYARLPESRSKKRRVSLEEQAAVHGLSVEEVGPIDSERFLHFVWKIAGRPEIYPADWRRERELVIWMDNYSVHKSERVRDERPELERAGITICYLPSYTPELSKIEPIWQDVKYHRMTQRSYTEVQDLKRATDEALAQKAADLLAARQETMNSLRRAA